MRKFLLLPFWGIGSLWGEKLSENELQSFFPWFVGSLLIVGLFFWAMYKALKTKNPKYGYLILFLGLLMIGLLFL